MRIRQYAWSLFVAQRYLFSKKSHNTINIISIVSMCGVAVGSMALICVLSVLNGFEHMVQDSFTSFDPDLKITSQQGRVFDLNTEAWQQVRTLDGVELFSEVFSGNVLVGFNGRQTPALIKGVSANYSHMTGVKTLMIDGSFMLRGGAGNTAVVGVGVANTLSLGVDFVSPIALFVPKRNANVNLARPETALSNIIFLFQVFLPLINLNTMMKLYLFRLNWRNNFLIIVRQRFLRLKLK